MNTASDDLQKVASYLAEHRESLAEAIVVGRHSGAAKENRFEDDPRRLRQRVDEWLTLLIGHMRGQRAFAALLTGQLLLEVSRPESSPEDNRSVVIAECQRIVTELGGEISAHAPEISGVFQAAITEVFAGLLRPADHHVRTVMIGDCFLGEVGGLAADILARQGITFDPFPINARDSNQLGATLDRLAVGRPDGVFFSPFSHTRTPEIEELIKPARGAMREPEIDALVDSVVAQTAPLLLMLAKRFDCPIYVHDAALVRRASTRYRAVATSLLTARVARRAAKRLNDWLDTFVKTASAAGNRFFVIRESDLVADIGRADLGRYLHTSEFQHATRLSFEVAKLYAARIAMLAKLNGRKLVVCDLDNTLWNGVIGEGSVVHFKDRQETLKRLRANSGVVLSIASKNDPARVRFEGSTLTIEDFVAPQISWSAKADGLRRLREALNIQYRHMVFVDDRSDERHLINEEHPDVLTMDATDPQIWNEMALWAEIAEGSSGLDRTQLYQQQLERDAFVEQATANDVTTASATTLAKLQFDTQVRVARKSDLARTAELVNRTNQWNLSGARTSRADLESIIDGGGLVLIAKASDRFGDMGDVCVAVARANGSAFDVDAFVLSCRVFGYGVETAVLATLSDHARQRSLSRINGRYRSTNQNQMARSMYADHGYTAEEDGVFVRYLDQ